MKLGKSLAELEFAAVDHDGSICPLLSLHCVLRQGVGVDAQEVANSGSLEFHISCHSVVGRDVNNAFRCLAEDPLQHIVEMDTDVGGHAAAFVDVAFPGGVVPVASGGDISEVDVVDFVFRAFVDFLLKRCYGFVKTKL